MYGLADAPRHFYLRLRGELIQLGVCPSKLDCGLYFFQHEGQFSGILACHVDDILWAGSTHFKETVIAPLRSTFMFGNESSSAFKYIGIEIQQHPDFSITMSQRNYASSLKQLGIPTSGSKSITLSGSDLEAFHTKVGQLNWLANVCRPDISFETCYLSGCNKSATVQDLLYLNKVISNVQKNDSYLFFPVLDRKTSYVEVYTDGSFGSLPNGGSQGGSFVFLRDESGRCCPLGWNSSRLKRVVRSALAAETLALCDGCETALFTSEILKEVLSLSAIRMSAVIDSQSLYEAIGTQKQPSNRRLRVEINALREMVERGEALISLVPGSRQLSDPLTKRGASCSMLRNVLQSGQLLQ